MKKLFAFILLGLSLNSFSQLSVSIDNRYGFKMLGSYDHNGYYGNVTENSSSTTIKSKKYNFGNGYQGGIGLRYGFKNGFGANLGVGYLLSTKDKTTYNSNSGGSNPYIDDNYQEVKARMMRINIGASYCGTAKLSPIIKMGLILAMGKVVMHTKDMQTSTQYTPNPNPPYNSYQVTVTNTSEMEAKFYGGLSLGFSSSMGVNYKINDNLSLALCLDLIVQDFAPKKGKLTKSTVNGVDQLPTMMKSDKEVEFIKDYTDVGGPPNNTSAGRSSKISFPLSSFGPSFSVSYTLGKKKEATTSEKQQ